MSPAHRRLLAVVGPTASGKTAAAELLAAELGGEVVSCDSMQVYKDMPILTQAPPPVLLSSKTIKTGGGEAPAASRVPVHLASFLAPEEEYSAARFRKDAEAAIAGIVSRGHVPILAGGTGLYFRALLDGLFESDDDKGRDPELRDALARTAKEEGLPALHARLASVDPVSAARIHQNDLRRVIRALEVFEKTRRPFSEHLPERSGLRQDYDVTAYFLEQDRAELYERINRRVDRMLDEGVVEEVKALSRRRLSLTAGTALGYREILSFLEGRATLVDAVDTMKMNTRRYAKRQISWFRHEKGLESVRTAEEILSREKAAR